MTAEASTQDLLPAELTMGTVMLKVGDMKLMTDYYQRALGLDIVAEQDGGLYLGRRQHAAGPPGPGARAAACPSRGEAGLFHTALLFEDQPSLAATVATAAQYRAAVLHRQRRPPGQRGLLLHRPGGQRHRAVLGPSPRGLVLGTARTS